MKYNINTTKHYITMQLGDDFGTFTIAIEKTHGVIL
jgi:hypothetical protein